MAMPTESASAAAAGDGHIPGCPAGVDYAYCHALWNVVQSHRQHQHGGFFQLAFRTLCLTAVHVQVRDEMVQPQQEKDTHQKAHRRRQKRQLSH